MASINLEEVTSVGSELTYMVYSDFPLFFLYCAKVLICLPSFSCLELSGGQECDGKDKACS